MAWACKAATLPANRCKTSSRRSPARRVASLLTVALASVIVVTAAAVASAKPASLRVTALSKLSTPRTRPVTAACAATAAIGLAVYVGLAVGRCATVSRANARPTPRRRACRR